MMPAETLRRVWLAVGWIGIAIVTYYTLIPDPPQLDMEEGDKVQHIVAYASLSLWFFQVLLSRPSRLLAGAGLIAMGIALEFAQGMTGYRFFSAADMAANTLGVLTGWLLSPPRLPNFHAVTARVVGTR